MRLTYTSLPRPIFCEIFYKGEEEKPGGARLSACSPKMKHQLITRKVINQLQRKSTKKEVSSRVNTSHAMSESVG
jgi:hypothetical protein